MSEADRPSTQSRPRRRGAKGSGAGRDIIIAAALKHFSERGYFGTSIRDIAREADMTAASLYHHFSGKQHILRAIMTAVMQDVLATTRDALLRSGPAPADQLAALVRAWVVFHAGRRVEAKVSATDLHCLDDTGRELVVALRDEQEAMFHSVVMRGVEEGAFRTQHPRETTRAMINMGTAVSQWFREDGPTSAEELADIYAQIALAAVDSTNGR